MRVRYSWVMAVVCSFAAAASAQSSADLESGDDQAATAEADDAAEAEDAAAEAEDAAAEAEDAAAEAEEITDDTELLAVTELPEADDNTGPSGPDVQTGDDSECALGDLCLGPVITLGVINPLGFGLHARYGEYFGVGVDYQFMPRISYEETSTSWSLITLDARFYPFGGAFWVGGGFAYQTFSASARSDASDIGLAASLGIPTFRLGIGFMGKSGFVMGIDLGVNIPLGGTDLGFDDPTGSGAGDVAEVQRMRENLNDAADVAVRLIPFIPQINLIRIGYLF